MQNKKICERITGFLLDNQITENLKAIDFDTLQENLIDISEDFLRTNLNYLEKTGKIKYFSFQAFYLNIDYL